MKRIGVLVSVAALFLACVVPAGAYQWNGESFLDDYYGTSLLSVKYDDGRFSLGDLEVSASVEVGDYSRTFDLSSFSAGGLISTTVLYGTDHSYSRVFPENGSGPSGLVSCSADISSVPFVFTFDSPVSSFSLSGTARLDFSVGCFFFSSSTSGSSSLGSLVQFVPDRVDVLVGTTLVKRIPIVSGGYVDFSGISFSSSSISSFSLVYHFSGPFVGSRTVYSFEGLSASYHLFSRDADSAFAIHSVPVSEKPDPQPFPVSITPSVTSLIGGGQVDLTVSGPPGTIVTASPSVPLAGSGTSWSATLPDETAVYTFTASFSGDSEYLASAASCSVSVMKSGLDPPGPVDPDPPGPVVPGEGDFEYTEISGAELAKDMVLGPNVATGGANVYWIYDSYETGVPPYEVTVPGGAAHQMAPARFPSISLSKSEATVTASIPSTSYTFSWEGGCRVERFESLLTGPPGFSGPGSSALDYVELQIPISSEEPVHNFDLTGAVPVETVYRAGSRSVTRVGGAWSLYVNGALVTFGTTDTYGNIQFNGFVYHSSEPITAITLRLVPTAAGLAFPSNTGRITFSWSMSLDFKDLSMVYLEGEDEAIDLDKFYQQVSDSQGSIDSYDKIESQWTDNMTSNWDALKLDEFSFDAGLISGFALLSGIFNDIWRAFGLFNVVWIAPLMLGISMLVIGRISRDGGKGKGSG